MGGREGDEEGGREMRKEMGREGNGEREERESNE